MPIRLLPDTLINQIAAGEVVERPAAAVKELVENALDAGASRIEVAVRDGGRALIAVTDDGCGMGPAELELAVERHATSKLPGDDLMAVATLGFRGEALPSIGAVSRLALTSRARGSAEAWAILVEGGRKGAAVPAAHPPGTRVEVRDLFYAVPARLKFLKAPRTELEHITDVLERLAMAHPGVGFSLAAALGEEPFRTPLKLGAGPADPLQARLARLGAVLGRDFADNALPVAATREGVALAGFVALPTYNQATGRQQYLFVNGRPVRDRLLLGAVRGAYGDLMPRDRQAVLALFLELPGSEVDVNVHPAKTEVRFRDPGLIRSLIVGAVRQALAGAGHRVASTVGAPVLAGGSRFPSPPPPAGGSRGLAEQAVLWQAPLAPAGRPPAFEPASGPPPESSSAAVEPPPADFPLGVARAQLHQTYILAESAGGLVIVDQHAAHERLTQERLKAALIEGGPVPRQGLLIPEVVELGAAGAGRLLARGEELAALGLGLESFGPGAVLVREVPALLGQADVQGLVRDLADQLAELDQATALRERLDAVCATLACHGSIRAGRTLAPAEMNALLRQIEATPHAGQCSHGRPTWVELKRADLERLFGRR